MRSEVGDLINYGVELARMLGHTIVIDPSEPLHDRSESVFHGIGCLAASIIAHFKKRRGDHYVLAPSQVEPCEYTYTVWIEDNEVHMRVEHEGRVVFDGEPHEFVEEHYPIAAL